MSSYWMKNGIQLWIFLFKAEHTTTFLFVIKTNFGAYRIGDSFDRHP